MKHGNNTYLETRSPMACTVCNKGIADCTCPDIDERLKELGGPGGSMSFRVDRICGKHYARCKCAHPFWLYSHNGRPMVEANKLQRQSRV
jgi:hypothetical protein